MSCEADIKAAWSALTETQKKALIEMIDGLKEQDKDYDCGMSMSRYGQLSEDWNALCKFRVGDRFKTTLKNGEVVEFVCADLQERTALSTVNGGLVPFYRRTFVLNGCLKELHRMNPTNTNKGGFAATEMFKWLNGTLLNMLPRGLRDMIKGAHIDGHECKLWLPSITEYCGEVSFAENDGRQFEWFKDKKNRSYGRWVWTRSLYSGYTSAFGAVGSDGGACNGSASNADGISFGFLV